MNFLHFLLARFGAFFRRGFVSGSHVSCVLVLPVEYWTKHSSGDSTVLRAQCLAQQWIHVLQQYVLDEFTQNFYVYLDSNPEVFFLRSPAERRGCSVDASGYMNLEFAS